MSYRADKLMIDGHTDTHTHAGNDDTRRPKLASGKNGRHGQILGGKNSDRPDVENGGQNRGAYLLTLKEG